MAALPENLYTAAQLRELDRRAVERAGIPAGDLMQRAGEAAWRIATVNWPDARRVLVLCGAGNNAGDGYIFAHQAREAGREVTLLSLGEASRLPEAAAAARRRYLDTGGSEGRFNGRLPEADLIVDALLGIGIDRPLKAEWLKAVQAVNASGRPVISLDIPTGLHADTGVEMGAAVRAAVTVCFIGLKSGLFTGAGPECTGQLRFEDLKLPAAVYAGFRPRAIRLRSADMREHGLPRRARDAHKNNFGHVLLVGGDHGMGGAIRLAAEAALRCGAGLVSVATRKDHVSGMLAGLPEAMVQGVEHPSELAPLLARAAVVAIGPGLGRGDWGRGLLKQVLTAHHPLIVDADALNLLAEAAHKHGRWILTPHPGEAGRLLGADTVTVQADRYACAERIAERFDATVVLKGAGSLIAAPSEVTAVCTAGNPGMAAPGMGDVLTGVLAALVAQGMPLITAAQLGVYIHATAGDLAARQGERGILARDLMDPLRHLVNG